MTDWKGETLIRAQPNNEGYRGRAHPFGGSMIQRRSNERGKCAVPGCGRTLGFSNKTGVCKRHTHHVDLCRCAVCLAKREMRE